MGSIERRVKNRVAAYYTVKYIRDGDYAISTSSDISLNGMFICTKNPPPPGSHLQLLFQVEGGFDIEISALVVWNKLSGHPGQYGMGVQFLSSIPEVLKQNILQRINRVVFLGHNGIHA